VRRPLRLALDDDGHVPLVALRLLVLGHAFPS
jgi:hypothetical protein